MGGGTCWECGPKTQQTGAVQERAFKEGRSAGPPRAGMWPHLVKKAAERRAENRLQTGPVHMEPAQCWVYRTTHPQAALVVPKAQ